MKTRRNEMERNASLLKARAHRKQVEKTEALDLPKGKGNLKSVIAYMNAQ